MQASARKPRTDQKGRTLGEILDWYGRAERGELDVPMMPDDRLEMEELLATTPLTDDKIPARSTPQCAVAADPDFPLPISNERALAWIRQKLADDFEVAPAQAAENFGKNPDWHLFRIIKCADSTFDEYLAIHSLTGRIRSR